VNCDSGHYFRLIALKTNDVTSSPAIRARPEAAGVTRPLDPGDARLSDEAAWTMVNIAWPMSCGLSKREVAGSIGPAWTRTPLQMGIF
jgi:hypothetical protein